MNTYPLNMFLRRTLGGFPVRADLSIYTGMEFECACGVLHHFDLIDNKVYRELPGMKFVIGCSRTESINCVKIKGIFRVRMETQFGVIAE